ncbi:MAG TPA: NAD(P)/FAD-dependent oxidoreductase [Pyrinomonadaceae bacterium]|nr:NAD(P)/FAD-dependent oxidoreductase [Pyrinomonadaceae bacterium]
MNNHRRPDYDVIIAGAGPAGTSAAIRLATRGARVLLAEAKKFPRPKLCGEFISPECAVHFDRLGVAREMLASGGAKITETKFYVPSGHGVRMPSEWFQSGGHRVALGLSRAEMDARLLTRARAVGVDVLEESPVSGLIIEDEIVRGVKLKLNGAEKAFRSFVTLDATGRARALSRRVNSAGSGRRQESKNRAPLVAFKVHLENTSTDENTCEIYFYGGGYGGLSGIENDLSNLCFIVRGCDLVGKGSDPARALREIVMSNKRAACALRGARVRSEWLSVALESFGRRELIPTDGLIAAGDAASFIDPFTGGGMLMALESGELAAETILAWLLRREREESGFATLAANYRAGYEAKFGARLRLCGWLRRAAFAPPLFAEAAARALNVSAFVRRHIARSTRHASLFSDTPT